MDTVTIRELRNHGGEVVDRVEVGGRVTVTRDGRAVAEAMDDLSRVFDALATSTGARSSGCLLFNPARSAS
jgi:PHD/YefM family antitoxin component YafN of YafNO toxin-antitoxin module